MPSWSEISRASSTCDEPANTLRPSATIACYHDCVNDVYALVRSLRAARWSRNRHFEAHATPTGAEARRVHRFLRALERDLRAADHVAVRRREGAFVVRMSFPAVRAERVVTLRPEEHALLTEDDAQLAARLAPVEG
jgi:hypothetical protein